MSTSIIVYTKRYDIIVPEFCSGRTFGTPVGQSQMKSTNMQDTLFHEQ
jgi:hypothetical protein